MKPQFSWLHGMSVLYRIIPPGSYRNAFVAVCKPIKELGGPIIRIMFGQKNNAFAIQHIGFALLYVGCLES